MKMAIEKRILLSSNEKYYRYRIPGMTVTARGTVLVWFEARREADDWSLMDVLLYRSEDGGKTFDGPLPVAEGTTEYRTVNNPVCIAGRDGVLHFLYCRNYTLNGGDLFYRRSDDDGKTWSEPKNIMAVTRPEIHNVFATGPCHGICTAEGMLLVPVWMVLKSAGQEEEAHHPAVISTLVSRDNGETWEMGEIIEPNEECPDPNETQAAQLPDGRIYMNVRSPHMGCRAKTLSKTGTDGWTPLKQDRALPDATCCGSVCTAQWENEKGERQPILLAVNCASTSARENLTCRASFDGGETWAKSICVEPGGAGYSDIAVLADGTVCVLYEQNYGEHEVFARFPLADLMK